jgi:hypothetical protein
MKKDFKELLSTAREEERHREEWRLRLALLKESSAYRAFWDELGHRGPELTGDKLAEFNGLLREQFGIDIGGYLPLFRRDEWFDRLNPYKMNDQLTVRFFYPPPPISQVVSQPYDRPEEHRHCTAPPSKELGNELKPSERILRVDLSRRRSELLQEFTLFLDRVEAHRDGSDVSEAWALNYAKWEPDNSRFRTESWQTLQVWRLRRQRKTYREIAKSLKIGLQAAKMAFRRAYELIEGRAYEPSNFRRENLPISKKELVRTCETCPIKSTCTDLCPDVLSFANQDNIALRELTIDTSDPYHIEKFYHIDSREK